MSVELIKKPDPAPKKAPKVRLERLNPTHIVDAWKLFERSLKEQTYPDLSEETPDRLRSHLFQYLNQPNTIGLLAKQGRKPVGMILGNIQARPYGKPRTYCFISTVWVEPEYRKRGIMDLLYKEYFAGLKKAGIFYWEAITPPALTETLINHKGYETRKLDDRVGGKC